MVANLVEKDFKRVQARRRRRWSRSTRFRASSSRGQVSRVAPVFDPATRTATMEIEVPNPGFRLKPGMYARVRLTVERRAERADGAARRGRRHRRQARRVHARRRGRAVPRSADRPAGHRARRGPRGPRRTASASSRSARSPCATATAITVVGEANGDGQPRRTQRPARRRRGWQQPAADRTAVEAAGGGRQPV